jgi:hypothetical protein
MKYIECPYCHKEQRECRCRTDGSLVPGAARPSADFVLWSDWVGPLEEAADYIAELAKEAEAAGSVARGCNLHAAEQAMRAALQWAKESGPTDVSSAMDAGRKGGT